MRGLPPTKRSFKFISLTKQEVSLSYTQSFTKGHRNQTDILSQITHNSLNGFRSYDTRYGKISGSWSLGGNLFGRTSMKFLNCSSNLDLSNPCVEGILGS